MEELDVSVNILDRKYKLKIKREDEVYLREAAQKIDQQAKKYGGAYAYKDHQDLLAMVALTQITQLNKIQKGLEFKDQELIAKLQEIDKVLTEATNAKGQ